MEEEEDEMLEGATAERKTNSRLGCQVRVSAAMEGLKVLVPEKQ
jgi:2Fe-2S ferredoxin